MVDEAKQEQEFEPTPYKHSNRQELDETNKTETVEKEDTEQSATPEKTTSFLSSEILLTINIFIGCLLMSSNSLVLLRQV